ncbi:MAG: putative lipid II flippase FtsW [Microcella sp.]|uniref:putative lipid II flippase FtsW n=1 Tax=Microcella sp. TaxID=1913979 RepID=UPI00331465DE
MTTLRPSRPGRDADPQPARSPARAIVSVRTLFGSDSSDYMIVLGTTVFLVLFGLVMVLSSSSIISSQSNDGDFFAIFLRQGLYALVAIPVMLSIARFPARFWRRWARTAVMVGLGLQLLVFTGLGYDYGGNQNWISIGGFTAQPSEFLKLALIVWLGTVLADRADAFTDWKSLIIPAVPVSLVAIGMVLLGQDLGTASIMIAIVLGSLFYAGAPLRRLAAMAGVVAVGGVLFALSSSSRSSRIDVWLNGCRPEDYEGSCWQVVHGTWALGSGGVFGVGLGNSAAKWSWLPHAESDFIFAVIGEELGLVGAGVVLLLFVVLAIGLVRLIRFHRDPFSRIVTGGVLIWIVGQAFVNVAVVLGLLPVLGVPLPLISVGGSALIASLLAIGVVLSLARTAEASEARAA